MSAQALIWVTQWQQAAVWKQLILSQLSVLSVAPVQFSVVQTLPRPMTSLMLQALLL